MQTDSIINYSTETRSIRDLFDSLSSNIAYYILLVLTLVFLVHAVYLHVKHRRESTFYIGMCLAVLVSTTAFIMMFIAEDSQKVENMSTFANIGILFIPILLIRHISRQVSYRKMKLLFIVLMYIVPCGLSLVIIRDIFLGELLPIIPGISNSIWYFVAFYIYLGITLIRAFLFCFNVFFQMSPRMRLSTWLIIISIVAIMVLVVFSRLPLNETLSFISNEKIIDILIFSGAAIALFSVLFPLYIALRITPSEDVIVTSREFVVEGLTTSILVLNRRDEILDWNKKNRSEEDPIPMPLYREPFTVYKQRIMQDRDRFCFFSEDVIISSHNNREYYYLLHRQEVRNRRMLFGYIIEISEITQIYSLIRTFEDVAYIDQLTSLYNRNSYLNQVSRVAGREYMPLAILVGDVNRLKYVNDVFGHIQGDALLVMVADIIKKAIPLGAYAARVGGDEFVLLFPNSSVEQAEEFIYETERLCLEIYSEVFGNPNISWGYGIMTSDSQSYNDVFTQADQMMYENKRKHYAFRSSGLVPDSQSSS
ncbi:MAG: GGDEF domain-containing protein [Oscillospiraceae bacterium]|nr:GGDEF domain-containing protein [Oscillospiraceae bacterium]